MDFSAIQEHNVDLYKYGDNLCLSAFNNSNIDIIV